MKIYSSLKFFPLLIVLCLPGLSEAVSDQSNCQAKIKEASDTSGILNTEVTIQTQGALRANEIASQLAKAVSKEKGMTPQERLSDAKKKLANLKSALENKEFYKKKAYSFAKDGTKTTPKEIVETLEKEIDAASECLFPSAKSP